MLVSPFPNHVNQAEGNYRGEEESNLYGGANSDSEDIAVMAVTAGSSFGILFEKIS